MNRLVFVLGAIALSCGSPAGTDPNSPNEPLVKNGTRLRNKYIVASDGTITLGAGLIDTQRGEDCSFSLAEDGVLRCLPGEPNIAITSVYYNNATCGGNPLAYSPNCESPKKYVQQGPSNCGSINRGNRILTLSEIPPPATLYSKSGSTCTSIPNTLYTAATGYRVYTLGAAVPATNFVEGTVMTQ